MALTAMSTVTQKILEKVGDPGGIQAFVTNGTDIKPGHIVTRSGETLATKDIDLPGGADEYPLGVVLRDPRYDIDAAFADDSEVNVALIGFGNLCWMWATANCGDLAEGQTVFLDAANGGYLVPFTAATAPAADTYATAGMQTALDALEINARNYVGTVYFYSANDASDDRPVLVRMR